jgi:hypothetical protein
MCKVLRCWQAISVQLPQEALQKLQAAAAVSNVVDNLLDKAGWTPMDLGMAVFMVVFDNVLQGRRFGSQLEGCVAVRVVAAALQEIPLGSGMLALMRLGCPTPSRLTLRQ